MRPWQLASRLRRLARRILQEFGLRPPASNCEHAIRLVQCNDLLLLLDPTQAVDHPHSQVVERTIIETGNWEAEQQNFLLTTARSLIPDLACEAIFIDVG